MSENNLIAIIENDEFRDFVSRSAYDGNAMLDYVFPGSGSTLLTSAVKKCDIDNIKALLRKGVNVNQPERGGATPLLLAIYLNKLKIVEILCNKGASVDLGDSYENPLMMAVRLEHLEIVDFLLRKGARINDPNLQGMSPLFWAIKHSRMEVLRLLASGGIPKETMNLKRETPLIFAVKNEASDEIIKLLVENGADVEKSSLLWAIDKEKVGILDVLIKNGANVNSVEQSGNSLLAFAVRDRKRSVVEYLVRNGANVCKVGRNGKSPLLWAVLNQDLEMIEFLLAHGADFIVDGVLSDAVATKNLNVVQLLYGKVNKMDDCALLVRALEVGSLEIAKFFMDKGVFLDDIQSTKFLCHFLEKKNYELVQLLVEKGAPLDVSAACGNTPLTKAVLLEDFEMISYLVRKNVDVNQKNSVNMTPLASAAKTKDFKSFEFLVRMGANLDEDPLKNDETLKTYFEIAKAKIEKEKVLTASGSNQEKATEETTEVLPTSKKNIADMLPTLKQQIPKLVPTLRRKVEPLYTEIVDAMSREDLLKPFLVTLLTVIVLGTLQVLF